MKLAWAITGASCEQGILGGGFQKEIIVLPVRKAGCVHCGPSHEHLSQEPSEATACFSQASGTRVSSPLPLGSESKGRLSGIGVGTFLPSLDGPAGLLQSRHLPFQLVSFLIGYHTAPLRRKGISTYYVPGTVLGTFINIPSLG